MLVAQSTAVYERGQPAAGTGENLSRGWSTAAELRAVINAIPASQRQGALAALRALIPSTGTDSVTGAFNA
jgi:hypothetical protein